MIVLDLNENDNLVAEIMGNENDFYSALNYLKQIPGSDYDGENKVWIIPRNMELINQLQQEFLVALRKNRYILAGVKEPYIDTGADAFIKRWKTVKKYMKHFKINDLYQKLYGFQKLGVSTGLHHIIESGGFLLSDDMGLGKTVQAIAMSYALKSVGKVDKTLVTCPKNVKYQWAHQIEDFTNLTPVVVDGYNKKSRLKCYDEKGDIYIINHDQLILDDDFDALQNIGFDMVVADEVHYFKNRETQRTQALKELSADISYKLGMTGTPIMNKPADLHSIFEYLMPEYLRPWKYFKKHYIIYIYNRGRYYPAGYRNLFELKRKISEKMIRRLAEDVLDDLPVVKKKNHIVAMDITQIRLHNDIQDIIEQTQQELNQAREENNNEEADNLDGRIMGLMALQMEVSDEPRLLTLSDSPWVRQIGGAVNIDSQSPKLKGLKKIVNLILDYHKEFKVVIFSRFARMVRMMKDEFEKMGVIDNVAIIYGDLNEKEQDDQILLFKNDPECRILVTSDAGATGIDLQWASHLINYDLPWTPATLNQRNGRIRRIGSKWDKVYVSNFLSENSIDERVWNIISRKKDMYDRLVENTSSQTKALKEFVKQIV